MYLPCCPVPNCLGKQGELSANFFYLTSLSGSFCHLVQARSFLAHLSEAALAEDAVHAEGLVGDLGALEPLPLEVAVEVLGTAELLERLPAQVLLHLFMMQVWPNCHLQVVDLRCIPCPRIGSVFYVISSSLIPTIHLLM